MIRTRDIKKLQKALESDKKLASVIKSSTREHGEDGAKALLSFHSESTGSNT